MNGEALWQEVLRAGAELDRARRAASINATDEVVAERSVEFAAARLECRMAREGWTAFLRGEE